MRIGVVGAGLAGLSAARPLADAGHEVRIFDKARGPSGRMATRRREDATFDHGAQYFTVRDPRFAETVESWQRRGLVAPWAGRVARLVDGKAEVVPQSAARFVGVPRMSAIGRGLSEGLDVQLGTRVERVERRPEGWALWSDADFELGVFDWLIVATPAPQAVPLLWRVPQLEAIAREVDMRPCHAAMVRFAAPLPCEFDAAFVESPVLSWVACEGSKPDRPHRTDWVLHSRPDWSERELTTASFAVGQAMLAAFSRAVDLDLPDNALVSTHRWLYARPTEPFPGAVAIDVDEKIGVCGDWTLGDRVEAAWLSGARLSDRIAALEGPR